MIAWTSWEIVDHRVSVCGRVVNKDNKPMPRVRLGISADSKQLHKQPRKQSEAAVGRAHARRGAADAADEPRNQPGQTDSRADGIFFFLDCPDGQYTVWAIDAPSAAKAEKPITVAGSALKRRMKNRTPEEGYCIELVLKH